MYPYVISTAASTMMNREIARQSLILTVAGGLLYLHAIENMVDVYTMTLKKINNGKELTIDDLKQVDIMSYLKIFEEAFKSLSKTSKSIIMEYSYLSGLVLENAIEGNNIDIQIWAEICNDILLGIIPNFYEHLKSVSLQPFSDFDFKIGPNLYPALQMFNNNHYLYQENKDGKVFFKNNIITYDFLNIDLYLQIEKQSSGYKNNC